MENPRYALVAYVRSPVGEFVEKLRQELHPAAPHLGAHVTILPPRRLHGTEQQALDLLEEICGRVDPFEIELGDVETFVPVTPTIFICLARTAYRLRELHDQLDRDSLKCSEEWPYMPHMTIAKMASQAQAEQAYGVAQQRWAAFKGVRRVRVEELTFVREKEDNCWVDLAPVPLRRILVPQGGV
jgi:2'-5' RNA ligase